MEVHLAAILKKMAAILDFHVASRADLLSIPLRVIMPNILLVSPFAQFYCNMAVICSAISVTTVIKIIELC